jgi:hypothetical protein
VVTRSSSGAGEPARLAQTEASTPKTSSDGGATRGDAQVTGIHLSFYPWTDNGFPSPAAHGLIADQGLLDAFAREYCNNPRMTNTGAMSRSEPHAADFFLTYLPNRLSNIVAGLENGPESYCLDVTSAEGMGTAQWLAHLGGYYAAVWLRACWLQFDGPRSRKFRLRDRNLGGIYKHSLDKARDVALYGSDAAAIDFSRGLLRSNTPVPGAPSRLTRSLRVHKLLAGLTVRLPGEIGIFGFNTGFLRHILPPSLNAPTDARPCKEPYYVGDAGELLDAHFALEEQPFLTQARETYAFVSSAGGDVAARLNDAVIGGPGENHLLARQQNWDTVAAAMYRVGHPGKTVYRGFDQEQYDRLLAWTSYSAMTNVASGFNALSAYATRDAHLARQQITSSILWWGFILTYVAGAINDRNDTIPLSESLPRFITAN